MTRPDAGAWARERLSRERLTVAGTEHLDDLDYLPCSCPICSEYTPADIKDEDGDTRTRLLAEHNLHVTFEELRRIKQAIRSGNLLELVERRARGHPAMYDGYRALLDHADRLEAEDPVSKGTFFHTSAESARRPEVLRHHERLDRFAVPDRLLLTEGGAPDNDKRDAWRVVPPFGPFPRELSDSYPFTATVPDRPDRAGQMAAADGVRALVAANPDTVFTLAVDDWPADALERVPDRVTVESLAAIRDDKAD